MHPGQLVRAMAGLLAAAWIAGCAGVPAGGSNNGTAWVASWGTAQLVPGNEYFIADESWRDASIRQLVHMSLPAKRLRVRITNVFGTAPLELAGASIAKVVKVGTPEVEGGSVRVLKFGGQPGVTIPQGGEYYSDPVDLEHDVGADLAISLHFVQPPSKQSGHPGSRTTSFFAKGNRVADATWADATKRVLWVQIADIEVEAKAGTPVVVAIGDSITDGHGATTDHNNRWTDALVDRLKREGVTMGVVNTGIGGNRLLRDGLGPNVVSRFDRDVLTRSGVTHTIILIGINDLGGHHRNRAAEDTPESREKLLADMKNGYRQVAERARANGICVIGGTLVPYIGSDYYKPTPDNDTVRLKLNEWIRDSGTFDAIADFDAALRDPQSPGKMKKEYSYDWLHPSPGGFIAMADAVPLAALTRRCAPR